MGNPTLTRFFSLHFLMPFLIRALVMVHLLYLHQSGSGNPTGAPRNLDKVNFHPYFSWKDLIGFMLFTGGFLLIVFYLP